MELIIFLSLCGSVGIAAIYSVVDKSVTRHRARRRIPIVTIVNCDERDAGKTA